LMIVDMVRNDLARLPDARNITAAPLLQIEEYPTVLQMTSTVHCQSNAGLGAIFGALFPCASVTGAPKIAAMRAIAELELSPRGVYCGSCGWAGGDKARFNVAIRTAVIDKTKGAICYGAGSGIVADSTGGGEWRECHNKTAILSAPPPPLLIETMRAEKGEVALLPLHLRRLTAAAKQLGFVINRAKVRQQIADAATKAQKAKLRFTMNAGGRITLQVSPLPRRQTAKLCLLSAPPLLFCRHKTNRRAGYEKLLQKAQSLGFDDAVLINQKGEITETCIANICAHIGGELLTPPLECGLLPGVMRAKMMQSGELKEQKLTPEDLHRAAKLYRLNAVRGLQKITLAENGWRKAAVL
ncbi:MAG: aminotransferase class IV, partial [Gammaproteobacteria bacterium]